MADLDSVIQTYKCTAVICTIFFSFMIATKTNFSYFDGYTSIPENDINKIGSALGSRRVVALADAITSSKTLRCVRFGLWF